MKFLERIAGTRRRLCQFTAIDDYTRKHLRDGAAVLVLESSGFVEAKKGTNAFTCEVTRRNGDIFPVCWDALGTKVLLPIDLDAAKLRASRMPN